MPRCNDWESEDPWLQERNILQSFPNGTNLSTSFTDPLKNVQYLTSSRNPTIDAVVQPGPYKETLPCQDLCFDLVQSCPASLGFACPQLGQLGFNQSYGLRPNPAQQISGQITCNLPGGALQLSGAWRLGDLGLNTWVFPVACFVSGLLLV